MVGDVKGSRKSHGEPKIIGMLEKQIRVYDRKIAGLKVQIDGLVEMRGYLVSQVEAYRK